MNKKNFFLALSILLCANQASAGWMDSIKSGFESAGAWVVSWMPESWQGRACVALGVCTLVAARYMMSKPELSKKEAEQLFKIEIEKAENKYDPSEESNFIKVVVKDQPDEKLTDLQFKQNAQSWPALDQLAKAYNYLIFAQENNRANIVKKVFINRVRGNKN